MNCNDINTKYKSQPDFRADSNLNDIDEGICRVRHKDEETPFAIIKVSNDSRYDTRWLVHIGGLVVASCGSPGDALKTCAAHYNTQPFAGS